MKKRKNKKFIDYIFDKDEINQQNLNYGYLLKKRYYLI